MLGTMIRQRREEKKISQEGLAEFIGVSRQAISKWEQEKAVPTPENLERLENVLELPAGALGGLIREQNDEDGPAEAPRKKALYGLFVVGGAAALALAFWLGRASTSAAVQGISVATPTPSQTRTPLPTDAVFAEEDNPITSFTAWPETLALEKEEKVDFDVQVPMGAPEELLSEAKWELKGTLLPIGEVVLTLARTVEPYDGPTLWVMGQSAKNGPYTVLARMNEDTLIWEETEDGERQWAVPVGNVLGYDSFLVRLAGETDILFSVIGGVPRVALRFSGLEGFADLDLDGEQEVICREPESPYTVYDREPDGYFCYTVEEPKQDQIAEGCYFLYDAEARAFGFGTLEGTQSYIQDEAPIYDRLFGGVLQRRASNANRSFMAGPVGGTTVFFFDYDPDQTSWRADGTPYLTARQNAKLILEDLEAITGYRPERCYLYGGYVSLESDWEHRSFFSSAGGARGGGSIRNFDMAWQSEWAPWSPLKKENVQLPEGFRGMENTERAVWWYERIVHLNDGPIASAEPSQYKNVVKCTLEDGRFFEITLDEDGYMTSVYGPYPEGFTH